MNEIVAITMGVFWLCGMPILAFIGGVVYARYGLPFDVSWKGFQRREDDDD